MPTEPTAYLHTLDNTEGIEGDEPMRHLSFSKDSPFGTPGVDHSAEFPVTSIPLYLVYSTDSEVEPDERNDQ